jgi:hypothetical protein
MMRGHPVAAITSVVRKVMTPMKPPPNPVGPRNPNRLSNWLRNNSEAGAAQHLERPRRQALRRSKSLVEMVEELKKRQKK